MVIDGRPFGSVRITNNRIEFTLKVYDFDRNWVLDIKDNYWVRNKNNTGAFNYNDTSFEILDNYGNVVLNVDFVGNKQILMQGYYLHNGMFYVFGNTSSTTPLSNKTQKEDLSNLLEDANVHQIFYHTGKDWLHRRVK